METTRITRKHCLQARAVGAIERTTLVQNRVDRSKEEVRDNRNTPFESDDGLVGFVAVVLVRHG